MTPRQMVENAKKVTFEFQITKKEEISKVLDQLNEGDIDNRSYKIDTKEEKRILVICPNNREAALEIFGIFWENKEVKNKPTISFPETLP